MLNQKPKIEFTTQLQTTEDWSVTAAREEGEEGEEEALWEAREKQEEGDFFWSHEKIFLIVSFVLSSV